MSFQDLHLHRRKRGLYLPGVIRNVMRGKEPWPFGFTNNKGFNVYLGIQMRVSRWQPLFEFREYSAEFLQPLVGMDVLWDLHFGIDKRFKRLSEVIISTP